MFSLTLFFQMKMSIRFKYLFINHLNMRLKIQTELKILKSLNKNKSINLLINQLETFLLNEDDNELKLQVKQFHRDCFILYKGLEFLDKKHELSLKDKKIYSDSLFLYTQFNFLL